MCIFSIQLLAGPARLMAQVAGKRFRKRVHGVCKTVTGIILRFGEQLTLHIAGFLKFTINVTLSH